MTTDGFGGLAIFGVAGCICECVFVFVFAFVFVKYATESNVFGGWAHSSVTGDTAIERYLGVNKAVLDNCPFLQSVFAAEYFTVKCLMHIFVL